MRCAWLALASLAVAGAAEKAVEFRGFHYQGKPAQTAGKGQFANPILPGFYPDPSLVRVQDDYYLVNSSFTWFPGVPIFQSRDLVHWKQIGHVLDRVSQLKLDGQQVSQGIFAPTIRYHDGLFYMITTNVGAGGNFYVTAKNPAGPWSDPVFLPEINGIDPSFFFDEDGKAYIVHNGPPPDNKPLYSGHRALWLFPFDLKTGKVAGPGQVVVNGGTDLAKQPVWIEGPHLFRRGGYYFLMAAEGGTSEQHSEVIFRSRDIRGPYGPYPGNPILTQRTLSNPAVTSTGHADLVETQKGEWWAVFLGCRPYAEGLYNTGRETFLLPVKWVDGWPVILDAGKAVPLLLQRPALPPSPASGFEDFNTLRAPGKWWERQGSAVRITPQAEDLNSRHTPSFLARRQQHADFEATVEVLPEETADAGLAAFQNESHNYFLGVRGRTIFLEKRDGRAAERVAEAQLPGGAVELKIEGAGAKYSFAYRIGKGQWKSLGGEQDGTILSTRKAGGFVGTYIGMFARTVK